MEIRTELSPEALAYRRKKNAEYQKRSRERNPEKHREYIIRYWERKVREEREKLESGNV